MRNGGDGVAGGEADEVAGVSEEVGEGGESGAGLRAEFAEGAGAVLLHGAICGVEICDEQRDGAFRKAREVSKVHGGADAFGDRPKFEDKERAIETLGIEVSDAAVDAHGEHGLRSGHRFETEGFSAGDSLHAVVERKQNSERGFDIDVVDVSEKAGDGLRCIEGVAGGAIGNGHGKERKSVRPDFHRVLRQELPCDTAPIGSEAGEIVTARLKANLEVAFPGRGVGGEPVGDEREDFRPGFAQGAARRSPKG